MTLGPDTYVKFFWQRVYKTDTCWLWTGAKNPDGYGRLMWHKRLSMAHRVAYELLVGPIPAGLTLDHVRARGCTNRHCVNPDHLEPVTPGVNTLRGMGPTGVNARKTSCPQGHEYTTRNGRRICKVCDVQKSLRYQRKKRQAEHAATEVGF